MIPTTRKRISRTAAALLAAGLASTAGRTSAAEPSLTSESALMRLILPYAPIVFDLAVQAGRSVAEITYNQRSYDPITANFVVSDLNIDRAPVDVSIRRLRIGENLVMAEGVEVDTRGLPLPPELREGLTRLGRETVTADIVSALRRDGARSALAVDLSIDLRGIGAFSIQGTVDNFHILMPLSGLTGDPYGEPRVSGALTEASLSYRDGGLAAVATDIAAEQEGVNPQQFRDGLALMPVLSVGDLLRGLPGGATPALQQRAIDWAKALEAFIRKPQSIDIAFRPEQPVPLTLFQDGAIDEAIILALNPHVLARPPQAGVAPLAVPGDPVGAALALVAGEGAPQDREGGARQLLDLSDAGNPGAVSGLAAAFGARTPPELPVEDLARLYTYLLVGRALDEPVSDTALSAVARALPADTLRAAELAAGAFFRTKTEPGKARAPLGPETVRQHDPAALRALAFDAYEGRGMTRDFTEAYALSLVAAAAGDRLATSLRDHLASAARERLVGIVMGEARSRAAVLWAAYAGSGTASP